ncbi:MAG: sulfotransferase [Pseudomonadota bacterium]
MLTNEKIKTLYAKALKAQEAGKLDEAAKIYGRILKANPNVAEVQFNMARIALRKGAVPQAAQYFEAALKLKPGQPEIWLAYLEMASRHPNPDNLDILLGRAGPAMGRFPETGFYRGLVAARRGQPEARALIEKAVADGLRSARAQTELGVLLAGDGETGAAIAAYETALEIKPGYDFALSRLSELYRNTGQTEKAVEAARAAIASAPHVAPHYYLYASLRKMTADDPMIDQMKAELSRARKGAPALNQLAHALGKAMEDTGQRDKLFHYLDIANKITAKAFPYDHQQDVAAAKLNGETFQSLPVVRAAACDPVGRPTPIFVTGLPRSGTTLVEQIISSHSDVAGAGEIGLFGPLLDAALRDSRDPSRLADALSRAGAEYRGRLAERFEGIDFVTDKSISSYASIGFIRHALPDARIIVVRRDPGDNALSIYKNMFRDGTHRYATDLRNIARFMTLFETQLAFWGQQMPDAFTEIQYEELIADPDSQSRALIAHAGLDWQDACLSFYDNTRRVDTLSTTQVRQPIYASSVGAWKRYEAEMAPFFDAYRGA